MWRCLAQLPTLTWKLLLARQVLQPSWQHLTRWSTMLDSHHSVNSSRLRWSPTAQSTGMLFSSWSSLAGVFCSHGFPLWCKVLSPWCTASSMPDLRLPSSPLPRESNYSACYGNIGACVGASCTGPYLKALWVRLEPLTFQSRNRRSYHDTSMPATCGLCDEH